MNLLMDSKSLIKHYQKLYHEFGASAKAVQWADKQTQYKRFDVLSAVFDQPGSVLDVGCGLGDYYHYLRSKGQNCHYLGVDPVPEFVDHANRIMHDDPEASAKIVDPGTQLPSGFDYVILSGVFNNVREDNWGFMTTMIQNMYQVATHAIAFNAMSTHVEYQDDNLFYVDPMDVFSFCKTELGGNPILRHDYVLKDGGYPFEFSMYVHKELR